MTATSDTGAPMRRSSRDPETVRASLERWLMSVVGADAAPSVRNVRGTDANGMSSDTVLFDATWQDSDGTGRDESLVARVAPDAADVPVFPTYDMQGQFDVVRLAGELSGAPVPDTLWCETGTAALGAPFFVMRRVDGEIPPDVLPYPFGGNWLYDAPRTDQQRLQDTTVEAIAALHAIDRPTERFEFLERPQAGDTHLRRHVAHTREWYDMVAREGGRSPLVERGFAWLDQHWPEHESDPVLSWGDSRIGNVIYRDFRPVALLDWEMAGLGPRELDVAWLVFAHEVFQELSTSLGLEGMPDFLRVNDVCTHYESLTGYAPRDIDFYRRYAALQWGIVFLRTGQRQTHFGEREAPADPEELIYNRAQLDRLFT
ncbi:MAG TPA: phosphotransferase family protein [Mycobacteriales bacterium]|nr:phosphotransferase family protein [Mycobacteriales bacterium]